jgi:hypothetical protein
MNVETETEATQFFFREYINSIFGTVQWQSGKAPYHSLPLPHLVYTHHWMGPGLSSISIFWMVRLTQPPPGGLGPHHEGVHGALHVNSLLLHPGEHESGELNGQCNEINIFSEIYIQLIVFKSANRLLFDIIEFLVASI